MTTFDQDRGQPEHSAEVMSPDAIASMERRLLDAFAQHHAQVGARRPNYRARWVAAAAVVVLASALAAWRGMHDARVPKGEPPPPRVVQTGSDHARPVEASLPAAGQRPEASRSASGKSQRIRLARPETRRKPDAAFVALPGTSGLPRFESGSIVRMDLPLSSLVAYGVDISGAAGQGPVATDVLVGQDGEARAIRLVSTTTTSSSITRSRQ